MSSREAGRERERQEQEIGRRGSSVFLYPIHWLTKLRRVHNCILLRFYYTISVTRGGKPATTQVPKYFTALQSVFWYTTTQAKGTL